MKIIEKVEGSKEASKEIIVDINDIVYVHSNVRKITIDELKERHPELTDEELEQIDLYKYHEIQYTKAEYMQILAEENIALKNNITDLELAITELYEGSLE